jgi:hypothetical protein
VGTGRHERQPFAELNALGLVVAETAAGLHDRRLLLADKLGQLGRIGGRGRGFRSAVRRSVAVLSEHVREGIAPDAA